MTARTHPTPSTSAVPADCGWFGWNIARGTTVWSDSVYRLHGYRPGQIIPSSALAFHHKHRDDLYGCVDALHAGMVDDRLIVHEHRLVDAQGQTRTVVMIARPVGDGQGRVRNIRGFLLPVDPAQERDAGSSVRRGGVPLVRVLVDAFGVSEPAARVMLSSRRPMTARRDEQQQDFAQRHAVTGHGSDLRRILEDSLFPLEHLTLEALDLAA